MSKIHLIMLSIILIFAILFRNHVGVYFSLMEAVKNQDVSAVKLFIKYGADVNKRYVSSSNFHNTNYTTVLNESVYLDNNEIPKLLIDAGARIDYYKGAPGGFEASVYKCNAEIVMYILRSIKDNLERSGKIDFVLDVASKRSYNFPEEKECYSDMLNRIFNDYGRAEYKLFCDHTESDAQKDSNRYGSEEICK